MSFYEFLFGFCDANMAWLPLAMAGVSALSGLLGNRGSKSTNNQTATHQDFGTNAGTTSGGTSNQTRPDYDFHQDQLRNTMFNKYMGMINEDPNLSGYRADQVGNMNRLSNLQRGNMQENMAARGINGPAVGTAMNNIDAQRFGNIAALDQKLPFMKREMNTDLLGKMQGFFSSLPMAQSQQGTYGGNTTGTTYGTGTSTGAGVQSQPGNMAGGTLGNLSNMLAFLYPQMSGGGETFSH